MLSFLDTDSKRRCTILQTLNDHFAQFIQNFTIAQSYSKIVCLKPYKVLSCFVYDWTYVPLKRRDTDFDNPMSPKPDQASRSSSTPGRTSQNISSSQPSQVSGSSTAPISSKEPEEDLLLPSHRYNPVTLYQFL